MKVVTERILKWANQLPGTATDKNMQQHTAWIVPAPLYAMHYVNDARYLPGDEAIEDENF